MPTAQKSRSQNGQKSAQAAAPRAFRVGVQSHDEINYDESRTLSASTQDMPVLNIPPAGFLRHLFVVVSCTTASNVADVAYLEDGPFSVIDSITLEDVNSAPIVGPMTGYDLMLINKYGGYVYQADPRNSPSYSATTGTGGTGGSFGFVLRVPLELVARDALGSLPNKSGTAMFKLRVRLGASTSVYSTAPTNAGTVRVRVQQVDWWDPDQTDLKGRPLAQNPPAVQTTQFWSKSSHTLNAGAIRPQLERVGYLIRNLIFILEDSSGDRTTTEFPDPFILQFEANILTNRIRDIWRHMMVENYGYTGTVDAAGGLDTGVFVETYCQDFGFQPGAETRRGYLQTSSAARLEVQGTVGGSGAHTLTILTNDVSPATDEAALVV